MENSADDAPSNTDEFFSSSGISTINTPDTGDETQTQSLAADSGLSSEENAEKGIELQQGDSKASENIDDSELSEHSTPSLLDANTEQLSEQIETVQEKTEKSSQLEPTIATSADIDVNFEQDTTQMTGSESVVNNTSVGGDSDAIDNKDLATDLPGNIGAECETSEVLHSPTATTPDSDSKPATGFGEGVLNSASSGKESTDDEATREVQSASQEQPIESLYHIKWIKWKGINTPIITQNENGPCPLLAVVNVLLLQRRINIPSLQEIVTAGQLMEYIGDCILEEAPKRLSEGAQLNYEQNMHDAIAIMNKLQTGLDVNVKFTGVSDFEFTPECIVFDLLAIGLYHGWLIDPQNTHTVSAVGPLSYNQLVEKIIASKQEDVESELAVSEGLIGEAFLEQTASQLTYHGLCELNSQLKNDQLCVFFRNNHFSTLYKHKDELFLLVTDQGFLTEDRVIWESLSNVEGDSYFVSAEFRTLPVERTPTAATNPPLGQGYSQEDQDYLVALSLQNEQEQAVRVAQPQVYPGGPALPPPPSQGPSSIQQGSQSDQEWTDLQLALQLQEEEQRQQAQQQQQLQQAEQRISTRPQQGHMPAARPVNPPQPQQRNTPQQRPEANEKCNIL